MKVLFTAACFIILSSFSHAEPLKISLWHSLSGQLGEAFQHIVSDYNQTQSQYRIIPVYKGEYTDALTSFAAAFRAKQAPAIMQVFEVGSAVMQYPAGVIQPLDDLLKEQHRIINTQDFFPGIQAAYRVQGKIQAMPFNVSVPVLFYNRDLLARVGIGPTNFPKTWQELEGVAQRLKKKGHPCLYTSTYPSWIHLEAFSAVHGLKMIEQQQAVYDHPLIIHHLQRLKRWQKAGYFQYGGRANDATILFTSGHCAILSQSSGSYKGFVSSAPFDVEVAPLPVDAENSAERHNNIIGGAAFWTISGHPHAVYAGVADFYTYLARAQIQKQWFQQTGYLPLGLNGSYAQLSRLDNPILNIARNDLNQNENPMDQPPIPANQIRTINEEALEAIFSNLKTPPIALEDAVKRANFVIMRFLRNVQLSRTPSPQMHRDGNKLILKPSVG